MNGIPTRGLALVALLAMLGCADDKQGRDSDGGPPDDSDAPVDSDPVVDTDDTDVPTDTGAPTGLAFTLEPQIVQNPNPLAP